VLHFPMSNLQAGKRRPALVVADLPGDDVILCQITSQSRNAKLQEVRTHIRQLFAQPAS